MSNPVQCHHWWNGRQDVVPIQFSTFSQPTRGKWVQWVANNDQKPIASTPVFKCIAWPQGASPLFAYKLKGPDHISRSPQQLAMLWRDLHGGVVVACDFRPDFLKEDDKPKQAFCVIPYWAVILSVPMPDRCFYEIVSKNVIVGFFLDFDAFLKDYSTLKSWTLEQIVDCLFACIRAAWAFFFSDEECKVTPFNTYVFSSSNLYKISIHLVAAPNSCVWWKTTQDLKVFVKRIRVHAFRALFNQEPPLKKRHELVDMTVYDDNHKFRIHLGTKILQNRPKLLLEGVNRAPPPTSIEDTLVCKVPTDPNARILTMVDNDVKVAVNPVATSHLPCFQDLAAFLAPFEVPPGSKHNFRWKQLSARIFMVPWDKLEQLEPLLCEGTLLHEAPKVCANEPIKIILDLDHFPHDLSVQEELRHICRDLEVQQVDIDVVASPPRHGCKDGFYHAIFQLRAPSYRHYRALVKMLKGKRNRPWLDAVSSLRILGADKLNPETGDWEHRRLQWWCSFCWSDNHLTAISNKKPANLFRRCSFFLGVSDLPLYQGQIVLNAYEEHETVEEYDESHPVFQWVQQEWYTRLGRSDFRITLVRRESNGRIHSRTNLKECNFHKSGQKKVHPTQTQKGDFYASGWKWTCWGSNCEGSEWSRYADARGWPATPTDLTGNLRALVEHAYPYDMCTAEFWTRGDGANFFGFQGDSKFHYHLRGPLALCRKDKMTNQLDIKRLRAPVEQWERFPLVTCASSEAAHQLLDLIDSWVASKARDLTPVGVLDLDELRVCYYEPTGIRAPSALIVSLRQGICDKETLPDEIRVAGFCFITQCLHMPPPPQRPVKEWESCGIPAQNVFHLKDDAAERDIRIPDGFPPLRPGMKILLDGPMGCGKTQLCRSLRRDNASFLFVTALRSLARNAATTFGIPCYLKANDEVRTSRELQNMQELAILINSLWKLDNRAWDMVLWDEFRQLLMAFSSENMTDKTVPVWQAMKSIVSQPTGLQIFADANLEPRVEGKLLCELVQDTADVYVIVKDRLRNPWNQVECYEMLGNECQMWATAVQRVKQCAGRTFFPVNEEHMVHVAEHLIQKGAFLCGSSEKTDTYRSLVSSTDQWDTLDVLCASGVISSGLSCTRSIFEQMINLVSSRSNNSWDNEQAWSRQRIPSLSYLLGFRNRGCAPQTCSLEELRDLERWTLARLQQVANIKTQDSLLLRFVLRARQWMEADRGAYRRNTIQRLHARGATVRFLAPVHVPVTQQLEIKQILVDQRKSQRKIRAVLGARPLTAAEKKHLVELRREQHNALSSADQHALDRFFLCETYGVDQRDAEHLQHVATEEYAKQLPEKLKRLRETILDPPSDLEDSQRPLHLRRFPGLRQHMTERVLSGVFRIPLDSFRFHTEGPLTNYQLTKEHVIMGFEELQEADSVPPVLEQRLRALMESLEYRRLHRLDPEGFPYWGTARSDDARVINYFKAFSQARAIPVVRKTRRFRVTHENGKQRRLSNPYWVIDVDTLTPRVLGFPPSQSTKQVVEVTSFHVDGHHLCINGDIRVPIFAQEQRVFFVCFDPSNTRWAWFLKYWIAWAPVLPHQDVATVRSSLTRNGQRVLQHLTLDYVSCINANCLLQIDWVRNEITDVSPYPADPKRTAKTCVAHHEPHGLFLK